MRVWSINQSVVNILVVLANPVSKASVLDVLSVTHHILKIRLGYRIYLLFLLWYEERCWRTGPGELEHGHGPAEVCLREAITTAIATAGIGL